MASATKARLIRGNAGNQVCFISLKHGLSPAKKPGPSSTPAALWNIPLHIHNSPNPPVDVVKDERGSALSALLALSFSAHSLWNRERKKRKWILKQLLHSSTILHHLLWSRYSIATDQNLVVFVSEASLPLLPKFDSHTVICLSKPSLSSLSLSLAPSSRSEGFPPRLAR